MTATKLSSVLRKAIRATGARAAADVADTVLVEQFVRQRNETAFEVILRRYGPLVLGACRRLLNSEHDVEDAFQATFLVFVRKAGSIRRHQSLPAWLHRVAYCTSIKARLRASRRRFHERQVAVMATADQKQAWGDLRPIIDEELNRLPEKYRLPLVLCLLEGKSHDQAAKTLGVPRGTVSTRVLRGRERLRRQLARRGVTLSSGLLASAIAANTLQAAVPPALLATTFDAAMLVAAGKSAVAISVSVISLANAVIKGIAIGKLKIASLVLLAVGVVGTGAGVVTRPALVAEPVKQEKAASRDAPKRHVPKPKAEDPKRPRVDRYGDPLPDGAIARLGTIRFRQGGAINSLIPCPDGKTLVSNTYYADQAVCLWDMSNGKLLREFPGNFDASKVALSPKGKVLAIGQKNVIHLWELSTGREIGQLKGHKRDVRGFAFSPDGKTLASGGMDDAVRLWDLATSKELRRLPWKRSNVSLELLAFTSDGKTLVVGQQFDDTIHLWDVTSGKKVRQITNEGGVIRSMALSPDGSYLATGSEDGAIPIWELATGKLARKLKGHHKLVLAVAYSQDGRLLACSGDDEKTEKTGDWFTCVWDLSTGKEIRRVNGGGHSVAVSVDSKTVVSASWAIRQWDIATGRELHALQSQSYPFTRVALSPDGKLLASVGTEGPIQLWRVPSAELVGDFEHRLDPGAQAITFSRGGTMLATGSWKAFGIWDVARRKRLHRIETDFLGHNQAFAFSQDDKTLAAGGTDGIVRLYDVVAGRELRRFGLQDQIIESVAFCWQDTKLAVLARGGQERWRLTFWDVATGKELPALVGDMNAENREVPRLRLEELNLPRLALSADGRTLAISRWKHTIPVWETHTGKQRLRLEGHQSSVTDVAISGDGRTLASASHDRTIRLWDLTAGKELVQLKGHRGKIACLAFSPNSNTMISLGDDSTVLVWEVGQFTHRTQPPNRDLAPDALADLWNDLAESDAPKAYTAIWTLVASAKQSVPFLREHLKPVQKVDEQELVRLIRDLDSDQFAARQKASQELAKLTELAEPALRKALADKPSPETRRQIEQLLAALETPITRPELLRQLRGIEALEHIGDAGAREVLCNLAKGAPQARVTQEAKASLTRLAKPPGSK